MIQTKNPLDITVSKNLVKATHKNLRDAERVIEVFHRDNFSIFDYLAFGVGYSSALAEKSRFEDYRLFIQQYNKLLEKEFAYPLKFIKDTYLHLSIYKSPLYGMCQPDFYIQDKTDVFIDNKFKQESELERVLVESLKNWSHEWIVKRQQRIGHGQCDINIFTNNEKLAIELKKDKAQRKDVYQAIEYTANNSGYLSVLIASEFDKETIELANELKVNCYEYQLGTPIGGHLPESIYLKPINRSREKTIIESHIEDMNSLGGHIIEFSGIPSPREAAEIPSKVFSKFKADLLEAAELIERLQKPEKRRSECSK